MRRICTLALLVLATWLPASVQALEMSFARDEPGIDVSFLILSGTIERHDPMRFRAMVQSRPGREVVVFIDSPGGNLTAASEIAGMVARWRMTVVVPPMAACASGCFLILAAATERMASDTARIGVHSVHIGGQETDGTRAATTVMARELARYGVPDGIIGRAVRTPPAQMAWLSVAELRSMDVLSLEQLFRANQVPPSPPGPSSPPPRALSTPPPPPAQTGERETAPWDLSDIIGRAYRDSLPRHDDQRRAAPTRPQPPPMPAMPENTPGWLISHEPRAFREGLRDREAYEAWFGGLSGLARDGALFWARNRSWPPPETPRPDAVWLIH